MGVPKRCHKDGSSNDVVGDDCMISKIRYRDRTVFDLFYSLLKRLCCSVVPYLRSERVFVKHDYVSTG